ncbi:MAG: molybdopterin-dependent oxidoreductase [Asgard group archaeon]|nr:molybdopterin-dependent oxidoreductase [Asgard group archaeon]
MPGLDSYPSLEEIFLQEVFPANGYDYATLLLPAAAFTEENGTITTKKGPMPLRKVVKAPDLALEDWKIVAKIAHELGFSGFDFLDYREIQAEMKRSNYEPPLREVDKYCLKYRGTAIADKVPDFKLLLDARKGGDTPW